MAKYLSYSGLLYFWGKIKTAFASADHEHSAPDVSIADSSAYFTSTTVEGALQELGGAVNGIEALLAEM